MLNVPNPYPFFNCEKDIKITEIFSTTVNYSIGWLSESNVTIQDSLLFQLSKTLALLSNMMSERFILTSSPIHIEKIKNIRIQQMRSHLIY